MPDTIRPSSLSLPCTNKTSTNTSPSSSRISLPDPATLSSTPDGTSTSLHGRAYHEITIFNTEPEIPPIDDHQARLETLRRKLRRLEEDVAAIKSLMEERERALDAIIWEVQAQGDDMEDVEDRSARTLRGLKRANRR